MREAEAMHRLSRSPHWVWTAIDPVTQLLVAIDVGERTLAMAQGVVYQVRQLLAPACLPLFLTNGYKEYATALLTHFGQWVQPPRHQEQRATPQATLVAAAPVTRRPGGQDRTPATPGAGAPPRGVWHPGGRPTGVGGVRLADPDGIRGAAQSEPASASSTPRQSYHYASSEFNRLTL
jgi:hypothetical protein